MSHVISTRSTPLRSAKSRTAEPRRLPIGYGLAIGATASLGLWSLIAWAVMQAL